MQRNCYNNQHFRQKMGKHSIEELIHIMCNEVWQEAHVIEAADYPIYFRDLLGEQGVNSANLFYFNREKSLIF